MREDALEILLRVEKERAYSNALLNHYVESKELRSGQKKFFFQLIKGTLELQSRLDLVLNTFIQKGTSSLPLAIKLNLRLATYQLLYMHSSVPARVVSEAVQVAKRYGHKGTAALTNAVLRKIADNAEQLRQMPPDLHTLDRLAAWYSHPLWLVEKLVDQIGQDQAIAFCEVNNKPWRIDLRVNALRTDREKLLQLLREEGVECTLSETHPDIIRVEELSCALDALGSFKNGYLQVQDESSAHVVRLLHPKATDSVLDLCAAPGGKATYLCELMGDQGTVVAVDIHANKLRRIQQSLVRLGIESASLLCADGRTLPVRGSFDRVLLDAPCSGSGVIGRKGDLRWNRKVEDLAELLTLQQQLLCAAAVYVQPGGYLLYGTCSVLREENEDQIKFFLAEHREFEVVPLTDMVSAIMKTEDGFFRSWPHHHNIGGAFGALLQRK